MKQLNCQNAGEHGGTCKYMDHFQKGGGHSDYSYIYCDYVGGGQKVRLEREPEPGETAEKMKHKLPKKCCLHSRQKSLF